MSNLCHALLLCLFSVPAFAATGLVDAVQQYHDLRLGTAKSVADYRVTVGHATFTLPSGTAAAVMAGDRQVGVYLSGNGTFTYDSVNKDEHVTMRSNAKDGDLELQSAAGKVTFSDAFKGVLLLGNGLPEISGADAAAPAAQFAEDRTLFARDDVFSVPAGHLLAYQALEDPAARVVYAEISGPSHPIIYEYDDVYAHDEELLFLRKRMFRNGKFGDAMWGTLVSSQAIGRSNRQAAPARVQLTNVDVNLTGTLDEQGKLVVVETLVPQGKPANVLRFQMTTDYFFDIEFAPRHFNVRSVTDGKGNKLEFVHDAHDLLVALAAPAPAGTPLTLRFEIDGDFLYRPQKSNYWELGIEPWFPWVRPNEQAYTFHSLVKVEKPFVAFASGTTVRRADEGNYNVVETKLDQPVNSVAILAGKYHYDEEMRNGVTVRVASFISRNERAFKTLRNFTYTTIEAYQKFLGPFPFEELTIIEKDAFGYGQAPAGIVFIAKEAFLPKDEDANEYIQGVNRRLAHEIAHQYWGGVVRITSNEDQWLEEAFAEYSAYVFLKNTNLEHQAARGFNEWKAGAKDGNAISTIPMANRIRNGANPGVAFLQRQGLIYAKGALLLAALHRELGDQLFLTFLKSYQKSFRWKYATTEDAIGLLQFMTKKDYSPWFEENYYGTGLPDVKAK